MRFLNAMATQFNAALIVVSHDEKIIPAFQRICHLSDGQTPEVTGQGLRL